MRKREAFEVMCIIKTLNIRISCSLIKRTEKPRKTFEKEDQYICNNYDVMQYDKKEKKIKR